MLAACVSHATKSTLVDLFVSLNRLSECFSKNLHQDFMAKTIYFS